MYLCKNNNYSELFPAVRYIFFRDCFVPRKIPKKDAATIRANLHTLYETVRYLTITF